MHFCLWNQADRKNPRRSKMRKTKMSKTDRANRIAVLDALKAHGCIAGYATDGDAMTPEWNEAGVTRAIKELPNPKPFGLKKSQRGWLLLLLPMEEQEKVRASFIRVIGERF